MDYEERKIQSLRLLNTLYDRVKGIADEDVCDYSNVLSVLLNLDHLTILDLAHYLQGKNLVKVGIRVSGIDYRLISITELGVKEVETARENKKTPIVKYPAGIINQVYNYGNIIQNSSIVGNVQSNVNITINDIEKIKQFINLIKEEYPGYNLDKDQKSEIESDIKSMEGQIASPKPKLNIIKELGRHILDIVKPVASHGLKEFANSTFGPGN